MEVKQEAEGAVPVDAQASLAYSAVAPGTHVDMERAAGATAGESEMDEDAGLVDQQAAAAAAAAAAAPGAGLSRQQRKQMAKQQVDERERLAELKRTLKAAVATPESDRTPEQVSLLSQHPHLVKKIDSAKRNYAETQARQKEVPDEPSALREKIAELARLISSAQHCVVYTGAGISTAAGIPDYRGPQGVWTQLQKSSRASSASAGAEPPVATAALQPSKPMHEINPTPAHMMLAQWLAQGRVQHIVSQNCDGLHRRSGVQQSQLSEIHGNCLIELCPACYATTGAIMPRAFDVTGRTRFRRHGTGRFCPFCGTELRDCIVHYGEKGDIDAVHGWQRAFAHAQRTDLIICLGTSLKVLRKYPKLWQARRKRSAAKKAKLVIVNLQWTPKDDQADLKIAAPVDQVLRDVYQVLGDSEAPTYARETDPYLAAAVPLRDGEFDGASQSSWFAQGLRPPSKQRKR